MFVVLQLIAYVGCLLAFVFATLSLACGLYYLAELVEEYTVATRKVIKHLTVAVCIIHFLLWAIDGLSAGRIAFSLACHGVYSMNLQTFPFINLWSLPFVASCTLVLVDHFLWFAFFSANYGYSFMQIAAFFGICVWLVPFAYFISLSAGDNILPNYDPAKPSMISATGDSTRRSRTGLLKTIFDFMLRRKHELLSTTGMSQRKTF